MNWITNSLFDIFKIGPGPSSSHTIGPMKAGNNFVDKLKQNLNLFTKNSADNPLDIEIHFFGSLALTGKGHGSDRAIVAGLLGETPENCDTQVLNQLLQKKDESYFIFENDIHFTIQSKNIFFHTETHSYPYQNAMVIKCQNLNTTYYSIGGGFIIEEGIEACLNIPNLPYRYNSMDSLQKLVARENIPLIELIIANECAIHNCTIAEIREKIACQLKIMIDSVERGLQETGILPGILHVKRRAKAVFDQANQIQDIGNREILFLDAYALATSEENATGNLIVTAPTSGSAGVMASLVYFLLKQRQISIATIQDGLMVAGIIGLIARHNGSISGAEVGCQGEIGVAASMGSAMLSQIYMPNNLQAIECAAEIALEHHLGLSCDPVAGYVQVPCIERNAIASVTSYNAFLLSQLTSTHKISFDEVIQAMYQTGQKMSCDFKETSLGGLAKYSCCM